MSNYSHEDFEADAECLYRHWLTVKTVESYEQLLDRCHGLFIEGRGDPQPAAALARMVASKWAEREFGLVINRCCYILINHWWWSPHGHEATAGLVNLLKAFPTSETDSDAVQRLQALVRQFTQSQQYAALDRWGWAAKEPPKTSHEVKSRPIGESINRYPMLYRHYLLEYDSGEWGLHVIKQRQAEREKQFEESLLRYTRRRSPASSRSSLLPNADNPTLLSEPELEAAIHQFAGKTADARTYQDAARLLIAKSNQAPTYQAFKQHLYEELTAFVRYAYRENNRDRPTDYDYGKHRFNDWLDERLRNILPEQDDRKPHVALRVQTCARLLDLLLDIPHNQRGHHFIFVDLTNNLGATFTVGLLLKIVLICYDGKPNLEAIKAHLAKRFAILFKHYEQKLSVQDGVNWLVDCLENWMVAASIHFGRSEVSMWKTLLTTRSNQD
jgi:hypothetical protein